MALTFPNRSRSFDEVRRAVRFIGYDGMFEVPFLIEAGALQAVGGTMMLETACLSAFDAMRASIQDVAREIYANGRQTMYLITARDLR